MSKHLQLVGEKLALSGGGNGGNMNDNERIARLEVKVDNIENTLQEMKLDIRELRTEIRDTRNALDNKIDDRFNILDRKIDANLKWFVTLLITSSISVFTSIAGIALHFIK